jgi:hypothetical protein
MQTPDSINQPGFVARDTLCRILVSHSLARGPGSLLSEYLRDLGVSRVLNHFPCIMWVCSLRGQDSRWFGYIQSLPRVTVDIAIFWGIEDVINFSSCLGSSRGRTAPSQSAVDNVEPARSLVELPEHTPSLQLQDGKQARMWLSCTEAEKELDGLMVSFSSCFL